MLLYLILTLLQVDPARTIPLEIIKKGPPESCGQDNHREGYLAVSTSKDLHREGYQSIVIATISVSSAVAQILPPLPSGVKPDTTGIVVTSLETAGKVGSIPLLTNSIPSPTSLLSTLSPTSQPSTTPSVAAVMPSSNIFGAPIATTAPPAYFQVRKDHPVPRLGIAGPAPIGTNKFYANFFLGNQSSPSYVHPYSLAWAKGQGAGASWGLWISHIEASQRVYGQTQPDTGAARYYLNPTGIQSLCLSAVELGSSTALTSDNLNSHSINVNLHTDSKAKPLVTFPLVQGMGFVTAVYKGGTPVISTGVFFKMITKSNIGPKQGVTKYSISLEDGKVWHVYAYSDKGDPFELSIKSNVEARATKPFNGIVQVSKDPGGAEDIIDGASGSYPVGVTLSGSASGSKGTYTFNFQKAGFSNVPLLMYALPHHVNSFDAGTKKAASAAKLQTTTKGIATGVVADSWTMVEPNMPLSMDFAPWDPVTGPKKNLKDAAINIISQVAINELSQNVDAQANQNSMYFSGKALAKFAGLCYTVNDLLKNPKAAQSGLANLKVAFTRFTSNKQQFPLYYESAWGGLVSSATYQTGNNGADFGNTFYNDHHFHYGYFIYAAAIIGYLDPSWLTKENVDYVNSLVRDIANPSPADKYFPVFRNFDWYHGHSWAHGLYETADGKDQESSSEDAMHAYAIKMWGKTIKDGNMEARGNLILSIVARSLNEYYLYTAGNTVQPAEFVGNKVAGILFENKCDHTTYFGSRPEYVQGIHMLPLLPSTKLTRPAGFVREEWATYFDNGRADAVDGGWKGILYANLATVDPRAAWDFFTARDFDRGWLDGGASLAWYMAYAAGEFFLSLSLCLSDNIRGGRHSCDYDDDVHDGDETSFWLLMLTNKA
ncbi:glycoside hydrolase family 81 protein [Biscogniauxia marginata]|nr:glycoside hydrolase family 81 protein [Biscogniauxia marginata]